ncbi:MAG: hypothetical protein ACYS9T_06635 [Planctomycetota bacterium]|jgi:hypothetical protein
MRGEPIIKSAVVILLWGLAVNVSAAKYSGGRGSEAVTRGSWFVVSRNGVRSTRYTWDVRGAGVCFLTVAALTAVGL